MKLIVILALLAVILILLQKFYDRLPKPMQLLYDLWMKFAHALGFVMSRVILSILWVVGFGPYAIIGRFMRKKKQSQDSYWIDIPADAHQDLHQQF